MSGVNSAKSGATPRSILMQSLITRFHLLLLTVTLAITGVAFFRVPPDYCLPRTLVGQAADWLWPREPLLSPRLCRSFFSVIFVVIGRC